MASPLPANPSTIPKGVEGAGSAVVHLDVARGAGGGSELNVVETNPTIFFLNNYRAVQCKDSPKKRV